MPEKKIPQRFYIVAGESSGDDLGANLVKQIKKVNPNASFYGVGGPKMQHQGVEILFKAQELAVMGFLEIIPAIFRIIKLLKQTAKNIIALKPDILITIDAPGFNFRLLKEISNQFQGKKVHYIAPTVWAYKPKRAKQIAKLYDLLLVILPFEPPYFLKEGLFTKYIGYSHFEDFKIYPKIEFYQKYKLNKDDLVLALTPGSRIQEIKKLLPIFLSACEIFFKQLKDNSFKIAILAQPDLQDEIRKVTQQSEIILVAEADKQLLFSAADLVLSKSGTITTQWAYYQPAIIVAHKINWLSYFFLKSLIKIKYVSIINIIANQELIPELLQQNCNPERIASELAKLWHQDKEQNKSKQIAEIVELLNQDSPSELAAKQIFEIFK